MSDKIKNLEHNLRLSLFLKFGLEDGIKESIKNNKNTFEFDGDKYTILGGLVESKEHQYQIDKIIEELIAEKHKEIEIKELEEDEEWEEIEEDLEEEDKEEEDPELQMEAERIEMSFKETQEDQDSLDQIQKEINKLGI